MPTPDPTGMLLVDKPAGITSHDVVAIVRRATGTRRVGHTGTLDPFATGLLVVLVGRGTRLIPYVDGEPKVYEATIRFGAETDTDDLTGAVTREAPPPSNTAILEALSRLTGEIEQVPPAYSAKKVAGARAYDAARQGTPLELAPAPVVVYRWTLLGRGNDDLSVRITCGGGTYVRALARDLGRFADSAAHLVTLRRLSSGPFSVADAVTVDQVKEGTFALRPLVDAIASLPARRLDASELSRVTHGNAIDARKDHEALGRIALVDERDGLVAIADRVGAMLQPRLVVRDA